MSRPPFAPKARPRSRLATGRPWEVTLEQWHKLYSALGYAHLDRFHPRFTKANGVWVPVGKGGVDFGGTLRGGRSIVFDAKVVGSKNVLRLDESRVPRHQLDSLGWHAELGALAYLMVYFVQRDVQVAFDIESIRQRLAEGSKSMKAEEGELIGPDGWRTIPSIARELEGT